MIQSKFPSISWLPSLDPLVVTSEPEDKPEVSIYERKRESSLFSGKLWPDFSGRLEIDLKPLIKDLFVPSVPSEVAAHQDNFVSLRMRDANDDDGVYTDADVNLYSEDSRARMSDADNLRVPAGYRLPICYPDDDSIGSAVIETRSGEIDIMDSIVAGSGDNLGMFAMIRGLDTFHLGGDDTFRVRISTDFSPSLYSPVYRIVAHEMEQYLFYNRLGGWDNIAMGGRRTEAPEMEFSSRLESGKRMTAGCKVTPQYVQNSGWMTLVSARALARLLSSPAVFHLVGQEWRRIVVTACEVSLESDSSQHSISFTYRYSEGQ